MNRFLLLVITMTLVFDLAGQDLISQQKAERLFRNGLDLIDHGQFGAAKESFESYMTIAPSGERKTEAEYYATFCALNLYHQNADELIENFVEAHPTHAKAATAYFDLGNFYYAAKNYKKAADSYGKTNFSALTAESQTSGRFRWAYSLFNLRQLNEALDQFNYVKSVGGQYGPAAGYYAGFIEYSKGDYDNALKDLRKAEQNDSYAKLVPYLIANVYYKQKNYDELIKYGAAYSDKEEIANRGEIALLVAEAYYKKADYANALPRYKAYLESHESNNDRGVMYRAGHAAYTLNEDDIALNYLKQASADKDSLGFYSAYYIGAIYLKKNQKQAALTAFDLAKRYTKDQRLSEESSYLSAKLAYDMGNPDVAIDEFEKLLKNFPQSAHASEVSELLSHAYVNANNYNRAVEYMEALPRRSVAIDGAYQKATLLKAMALFNAEDYGAAVVYFEKSLQYPVDSQLATEAAFWCGESYSIGKKYDLAILNYNKVIGSTGGEASPVFADARYGLGYAHYNLKQYDQALFNFKDFVNRAKGNVNLVDGLLRLADCYYISKAYTEALANFEKAIQLRSSDTDYALLQSGIIYGIQSKYTQAYAKLDQLIGSFPKSAYAEEARFQKAQLEFEQGNYSSAVQSYSSVITINPSSKFTPYAYMRRAASYYNLKDYGKSADDYIQVVEKFSGHPVSKDVLVPLQESLSLANRSSEFDKYLAAVKAVNPDAKGIETIEFDAAKNFYFNQDYARAIKGLDSFILSYPSSVKLNEATYYLAESYYRTKETAKALQLLHKLESENSFSMYNKIIARISELEFKQGAYEKAIPYFRNLSRLASNKKELYTAWSGLMEAHYLLANYDSVPAYSRLILEQGSVNAGAQNKASLYLGKAALAKGDYETAKDEFLNTLNSAHDEYGAEAKYLLAEIFFFTKEHKQCFETLVQLNADFAPYPEWVGKSFLLMADNYLANNEVFQAKATLKSLDEFPLQWVRESSKEKLRKIEEEESKTQNRVLKDSTEKEKKN